MTASVKAAAGRRVDGAGDVALEDQPALLARAGLGAGHRGQKRLGIGMPGGQVEVPVRGQFHQLAQIHHGNAVGDVLHHGQVVGHHQIG